MVVRTPLGTSILLTKARLYFFFLILMILRGEICVHIHYYKHICEKNLLLSRTYINLFTCILVCKIKINTYFLSKKLLTKLIFSPWINTNGTSTLDFYISTIGLIQHHSATPFLFGKTFHYSFNLIYIKRMKKYLFLNKLIFAALQDCN